MSHYDDDHQDESFFVSMTDIMVGLLFIFILIIMYFAVQAKIDDAEKKRLKAEVAVLTTFIEEEGVVQYTQLKAYQTYIGLHRTSLLKWISAYLKRDGIEGVQVIEEEGILRLPDKLLFNTGKFDFESGSETDRVARSLASALGQILPCSVLNSEGRPYKSSDACSTNATNYHNENMAFVQAIYVEGHTDNEKINAATGLRDDPRLNNNLKLSARRATNTFETLVDQEPEIVNFRGPNLGNSVLRFEPVLASSAYGEDRPVYPGSNDSEEGRKLNRRIDLRVVMFVPPNIDAMRNFVETIGVTLRRPGEGAGG